MKRQPFKTVPKPRLYSLIAMILAAVAVGVLLLNLSFLSPLLSPINQPPTLSTPVSSPVTVAAPPLLYNPDSFYEEPLDKAPTLREPSAATPQHDKTAPPRLAIIIDDVGLSRSQTQPVIDLPAPLAMAFLPYGAGTASLARAAHMAGHTVMLHMPMQPKGGQNPGPNAIMLGQDAATIDQHVRNALASIPHVQGVNNHMGSAATADKALMQATMAALAQHQPALFFIDSYTNPASVAWQAARAVGLKSARRHVFLDNQANVAAINQQLQLLAAQAEKHGSAIGIGHPYPETIAALQAFLPTLDKRGIKLVPINELTE